MSELASSLSAAYGFDHPAIEFGHAITGGAPRGQLPIRLPLRMLNRHGLIAGATGTGKTRSLQLLAEHCSRNGIPAFVSDVKGDLSGLAAAAQPSSKLTERMARVDREFSPEAFPVEYFSLTGEKGAQLRATVSSFGPILLAKVLDLTETQQSVLALVFKYCDDRELPLLDFKDLREVLNYLTSDAGKAELKKDYGGISPASVGVLFRKMVELEQQGADRFFGEPELDLSDLMRTAPDGRGIISIRDSAHEILQRKLAAARLEERERALAERERKLDAPRAARASATRRRQTLGEQVVGNASRQAARTLTSIVAREILGVLGFGRSRRR